MTSAAVGEADTLKPTQTSPKSTGRKATGREAAHERGRRLLVEGRVIITHVSHPAIHARVRGDSAEVHVVSWRADHGWHCTCDARNRCAHLVAVQLVVVVPADSEAKR